MARRRDIGLLSPVLTPTHHDVADTQHADTMHCWPHLLPSRSRRHAAQRVKRALAAASATPRRQESRKYCAG